MLYAGAANGTWCSGAQSVGTTVVPTKFAYLVTGQIKWYVISQSGGKPTFTYTYANYQVLDYYGTFFNVDSDIGFIQTHAYFWGGTSDSKKGFDNEYFSISGSNHKQIFQTKRSGRVIVEAGSPASRTFSAGILYDTSSSGYMYNYLPLAIEFD